MTGPAGSGHLAAATVVAVEPALAADVETVPPAPPLFGSGTDDTVNAVSGPPPSFRGRLRYDAAQHALTHGGEWTSYDFTSLHRSGGRTPRGRPGLPSGQGAAEVALDFAVAVDVETVPVAPQGVPMVLVAAEAIRDC